MRLGVHGDRSFDRDAVNRLTASIGIPEAIEIRPWSEADFDAVQRLSGAEGWSTPVDRPEAALRSWAASWPALIAESGCSVAGFVRSLSDGFVTTYVAEILVAPEWRGKRIGTALLAVAQYLCPGTRIDLLATGDSAAFYRETGFRPFDGYRRSWGELEALIDEAWSRPE